MDKFSFNTIKDFDTHISKSIPNYVDLSYTVGKMASYFIKGNNVVDIGCSTGKLLDSLSSAFAAKYYGYDISQNLIGSECNNKNVVFIVNDVTTAGFPDNTDLFLSLFTLQFTKPDNRQQIIKRMYDALNDTGALIISEKCYENNGFVQDLYTFTYYDYKREAFTPEEIFNKQHDLRSIMRPFSPEENKRILYSAGFKTIETFWQSLNFRAWVCIK